MVKSATIPQNQLPATRPAASAQTPLNPADPSGVENLGLTAAGEPNAEQSDAFDDAARPNTSMAASSLNNALTAGLSAADASKLLGSFAQDASIGDFMRQSGAIGLLNDPTALQKLSPPVLDMFLEGVLGQLIWLAQSLGQPLSADVLTMLATLDGQPASLLDAHTDATTLWRAMALSNQPLDILTLAATGRDVDADSGLTPNQAYRVLGTFIDANLDRQVRLLPGGPSLGAAEEKDAQAKTLTVPFDVLQRSILLALIGHSRIEIPYAHQLDAAGGPGQANCCMFAHDTGAARGTSAITQRPANASDTRCRSCAFARQLCLPG